MVIIGMREIFSLDEYKVLNNNFFFFLNHVKVVFYFIFRIELVVITPIFF